MTWRGTGSRCRAGMRRKRRPTMRPGALGPPPQHTSLPLTPDAQSESTPRSDPAKSPLTLADDLEKIARDYQDGQQFGV